MTPLLLIRAFYGVRDIVSIVIYFIFTPRAREDASIIELIREEFEEESPLSPQEDLRRLEAQLEAWNRKQFSHAEPYRAIAIYGINAQGWDNGAIYRSRSVRGWHQRRIRRLSRYFRVSALVIHDLSDVQAEIDRLKALYPSAEVELVTCTSHGCSGEILPYMSARTLRGLAEHASFVVDACEVAQGEGHFISRMARLNPGVSCWGPQEEGGNATIYFKRVEGAYQVRAVYWLEDTSSLFWGSPFTCCRR